MVNNEILVMIAITLALTLAAGGLITIGTVGEQQHHLAFASNCGCIFQSAHNP
jgi:hypothetical protein